MSYLTYNGQYITQDGKFTLDTAPAPETIEVVDFAGDDYVNFTSAALSLYFHQLTQWSRQYWHALSRPRHLRGYLQSSRLS